MKNRGRRTWGWALGLSVVLALLGGVASAKKPPKPPPEPATGGIYYYDDGSWYLVSPDGRNPTALDLGDGATWPTHRAPSGQLHNGKRWFLERREVDGEQNRYPDGNQHRQLWAVSEDGESEAMLLYDTSIEIVHHWAWWGDQVLQWVPGDQAVSFVALVWDGNNVVEGAIYKLPIAYEDGNPSGANGDPELVVASTTYRDPVGRWHVRCERGFAWSPDGSAIVYCNHNADYNELYPGEVRITEIDTPYASLLLAEPVLLRAHCGPDWSVNDEILYASSSNGSTIHLINADGTNPRALLQYRRAGFWHEWPSFSPDGESIVYCLGPMYTYSLGSGRTKRLGTGVYPYWR